MGLEQCCKSFSTIRCVAVWAGVLGLIQSLIWIGLSIVSILAYCCILDISDQVSFGSITKFVFFELYFRGDCKPDIYAEVDYSMLNDVDTVFNSEQILIWTCVYMALSLIWFISSCLLLSHVRKDDLKTTGGVLYTWATIALIVCCMDLSLGVIFAIDYSRFQWASYNFNLESFQAGTIYPQAVQLISGQIAAISMMIISLKGFVLWVINLGLMIYIFIAGFLVQNAVLSEKDFLITSFSSNNNSVLATRAPINAYDSKNEAVFENATFVVEERSSPVELNEESINRAARMSTDNLQERRFRNIDSFQQYPPPRQQQQQQPQPVLQQQQQQQPQLQGFNEPPFPAPDYTPPMPRANQNGQLRNTRYQ